MEVDSRVALVTGASRGIGRATSLALARDGMRIIANYLSAEDDVRDLADQVNMVTECLPVRADVSDLEQVVSLINHGLGAFGRLDVLVNNAGAILRPGDWKHIDLDTWRRTFDVNLLGQFHCIRQVAPLFRSNQRGKIINITSTYGVLGAAGVVAYTAAKAGVISLTRSFAKELAPYVTVNAVAPGNIDTEMTRGAGEDFIRQVIEETPLNRLGKPEDVADVISFLASDRADFITGQVIVVDGGHMLR
jgi:3-oxoacyl-[acyl-carrier protein] reductase